MLSSRSMFALGLAASVAVHATLWWKLPRYPGRPGTGWYASKKDEKPASLIVLPPTPKKSDEPDFGEKTGSGRAINSSPGATPQAGPKPLLDQAALTRDPTGNGPAAAAAAPPKPLAQPVTAPPPSPVPTPPASPFLAFRKPTKQTPQVEATPNTPLGPRTPKTPPPEKPAPKTAPSKGGRPIPHSDRESDPFASQWAAEFKNGEVVSRTGRQLKMARPNFTIGSFAEAPEITLPATPKFRVTIDATGHPKNVSIGESSGSPSIDRAMLLAIYQSWFEPMTDDAGQPVNDSFTFAWTVR